MSIRAHFQSTVDEFISDLESFSTGDYLLPDEKEFWDQPFDPKALPELRKILEGMLDSFDNLSAETKEEDLLSAVKSAIKKLDSFNRKYHDAVVEPEEKEEINALISKAAAETGVDEDVLNSLPELD